MNNDEAATSVATLESADNETSVAEVEPIPDSLSNLLPDPDLLTVPANDEAEVSKVAEVSDAGGSSTLTEEISEEVTVSDEVNGELLKTLDSVSVPEVLDAPDQVVAVPEMVNTDVADEVVKTEDEVEEVPVTEPSIDSEIIPIPLTIVAGTAETVLIDQIVQAPK